MRHDIGNSIQAPTPLPWDSKFFGFTVGQWLSQGHDTAVPNTSWNAFQLVYAFTENPWDAAFPKGFQCSYQGQHIHYRCAAQPMSVAACIHSYKGEAVDARACRELACVAGHVSRFRQDPKMTHQQFQDLYHTWMDTSLSGARADSVLYIKENEMIVGLLTGKTEGKTAKIGLIAVHPSRQNEQMGQSLLQAYIQSAHQHGLEEVWVTTQGSNAQAQNAFQRAGFQRASHQYVYHFWKA